MSYLTQCYNVSCLETEGPSGPKGHRGQKVSLKHTHSYSDYIQVIFILIHHFFLFTLFDCRELKETMAIQDQKDKEVAQETLVLRVPLVSPVLK